MGRLTLVGMIGALVMGLTFPGGVLSDGEKVLPTDKNVDIYGYGDMLVVGDVITAYDPDGVVCGKFIVEKAGQYGLMHVYGDDATSSDKDEGADEGEEIRFFVNGVQLFPRDGGLAVWSQDGDCIRIDF
jgi:hypothetical protein